MFFKTTAEEFKYSFTHPYQWFLLAWFDIKQRYRRSVLGPFWITISTAILIGTLGLLWSQLFKMNIKEYLPYFAVGNIMWGLISSQINEATSGFSQFDNVIKQHRLPYPSYILRLMSRNFIIMLHNLIIIIAIVFFSENGWTWYAFLALPGLALLSVVTYFVSLIFAILCTRYRDLVPIVQNFVTVAYFLSPIMWQQKSLPEKYHWVTELNPITHLLDIVRLPLLGQSPGLLNWLVAIGLLLVSTCLAYCLMSKVRNRISYWL